MLFSQSLLLSLAFRKKKSKKFLKKRGKNIKKKKKITP
jgi:hypothetical protein